MTPAAALAEARHILSKPEMMFNEGSARALLAGLVAAIDSSSCFAKAVANGEEVFVLRQQDMAAPPAIKQWAVLASANGCGKEKTDDALATAIRWESQPNRKWPD